ncbi:phosphotransferase [Cupriavidus alkaliphilus]|uniref:phosphotransferase n=1 Tax=Cupriavidus alkaliphilus TaxID=942866 RepID=UPI000815B4EC|nr:phosphotransferase [Cupriavidus alkaliphilus]SCB20883.1 Phosphotransferase enzyme family protein [Cupriavidus alkaliphilus]
MMTELSAGDLKPLEPIVGRVDALTEVSGGLFNRVMRGEGELGVFYVKQLTDSARSGSFPPLPTSRTQRYAVAVSWHEHALACSADHNVVVPVLLGTSADDSLIVMSEVSGRPLYEDLVTSPMPPSFVESHLRKIVAWLGRFHERPMPERERMHAASDAFKRYKVGLQYLDLFPLLPSSLLDGAGAFVASYLQATDDVVHGDLNSRNVLVESDKIAVIDFEQGHLGEGIYDLAYILSEYVIFSHAHSHTSMETFIGAMWREYVKVRPSVKLDVEECRFQVHLGFQTLYRLVGPSRTVWSGHLDDFVKRDLTAWSMDRLSKWLPT